MILLASSCPLLGKPQFGEKFNGLLYVLDRRSSATLLVREVKIVAFPHRIQEEDKEICSLTSLHRHITPSQLKGRIYNEDNCYIRLNLKKKNVNEPPSLAFSESLCLGSELFVKAKPGIMILLPQ